MTIIKKTALCIAAISAAAMPIAASAAPVADLRAVSIVKEGNEADGVSWALILLGLAAAIGLIIVVADDSPSSP